jgi:hypothetical protein
MLNKDFSYFLIEDNFLISIDFLEYDSDLPCVDVFGIVRAYEEDSGYRKSNHIYIWKKHEGFKCEISLKNIVGYENGTTFVDFGDTELSCIKNVLSQFLSSELINLKD